MCFPSLVSLFRFASRYQSAHSLGGERLERYGRHGPLGCAITLVRESDTKIFFTKARISLAASSFSSFSSFQHCISHRSASIQKIHPDLAEWLHDSKGTLALPQQAESKTTSAALPPTKRRRNESGS